MTQNDAVRVTGYAYLLHRQVYLKISIIVIIELDF